MDKIQKHINKRCVNCEYALLHFNKFGDIADNVWINSEDYKFYKNEQIPNDIKCFKFGDAKNDHYIENIIEKCIVWKRNQALKKIKKL